MPAHVRQRLARVHGQVAERGRRHHGERVHQRAEVAHGRHQPATLVLAAGVDPPHDGEGAAAQRLGQRRIGREVQDRRPRHELVGERRQQLPPRVQHVARALEREEQRARVELRVGVDLELDRGDDAEVAVAAAQRPEQVGLVDGVRADEVAFRGHDLERGDAVGLEAVLARQPAHPAAEGIARDADVGRGAVERREAEIGQRGHDLLPAHAGADADAPRLGVDLDLVEVAEVDEDRVLERAVRPGVVAGRLGADPEAVLTGVADRGDDVALAGGEHDRGRLLVDEEVEGAAGVVPSRGAGDHEAVREWDGAGARSAVREEGGGHGAQRPPSRHSAHRGRPGSRTPGFARPGSPPNPFGYGGPNYPASATSSSRRDPIPSFW